MPVARNELASVLGSKSSADIAVLAVLLELLSAEPAFVFASRVNMSVISPIAPSILELRSFSALDVTLHSGSPNPRVEEKNRELYS